MREGKLTPGQRQYQMGKINFERMQMQRGRSKAAAQWLWRFKNLDVDEAQHVYDMSSPSEREVFLPELNRKRTKARMPKIGQAPAFNPNEFEAVR